MTDPFSISLGVVALLQLTYSAGNSLRKFINDAGIVDATLQNLHDEINQLARVLESMRATFGNVKVEQGTGHVAAHWRNVAQSIEDGKSILQQLGDQIANIGQNSRFLDGTRKQHRLNSHKSKITAFRIHVQSYRDGLQLSLQTIILRNQVSHQDAASQVLPALNDLQNDIRRIAVDMNQKIETLQALVVSKQDQDQLNSMQHLHDCVRSAASIVSSASTILSTGAEDDSETVILSSGFGDCFPVEQTFAIHRWMQAQTVAAYDDAEPQAIPQSAAPIGDGDRLSESSDSEADLESELISALLRKGKQRVDDGDDKAAERPFRNCLSRLSTLQATKRSARYTSRYLDVMEQLFQIYWRQKRSPEAQNMLQGRMAGRKHVVGNEDEDYLGDVFMLACVTHYEGKLAEAQLHARRALRGYRRLQNKEKVIACLELLIDQSKADGNEEDIEAYSLLLEDMRIQYALEPSASPLSLAVEEAAPSEKLMDYPIRGEASLVGEVEKPRSTEAANDGEGSIPFVKKDAAAEETRISSEKLLYHYCKKFNVLLIDFRSRDKFDHGHISHPTIVCVDPFHISPGISADQLLDRLATIPDTEQNLFKNRGTFDRIVYYDTQTQARNYLTRPTRESEKKLKYLHEALYDFGGDKQLKHPPMLLMGGIEAWADLVGPQSLATSDTVADMASQGRKNIQRRPEMPEKENRWHDLESSWLDSNPQDDEEEQLSKKQAGKTGLVVSTPPVLSDKERQSAETPNDSNGKISSGVQSGARANVDVMSRGKIHRRRVATVNATSQQREARKDHNSQVGMSTGDVSSEPPMSSLTVHSDASKDGVTTTNSDAYSETDAKSSAVSLRHQLQHSSRSDLTEGPFHHIEDLRLSDLSSDERNNKINHLLNMAEEALEKAQRYLELDHALSKELGYVEYVRASKIIAEVIPSHNDWSEFQEDRCSARMQRYWLLQKKVNEDSQRYLQVEEDIIRNNKRYNVQCKYVTGAGSSISRARSDSSTTGSVVNVSSTSLTGSTVVVGDDPPKDQTAPGRGPKRGHRRTFREKVQALLASGVDLAPPAKPAPTTNVARSMLAPRDERMPNSVKTSDGYYVERDEFGGPNAANVRC